MRHWPYAPTLLLLIFISSTVFAQDSVDAWRDPMNRELYSQRYSDKRLLEQRIRSEVTKLNAAIAQRDRAVPKNLPTDLVQHVRRQEGIEYPSDKELLDQSVLDPKVERQIVVAATDFYTKLNAKPPQAAIVVYTKCTQAKRTRLPDFQPDPSDAAPKILSDMLFIDKSDADDMDLKLFGSATRSFVIDRNKPSPVDAIGTSLGVGCLPSRILTTNKAQYLLEGTEALKNFDANPDGGGELPEYLKPRFEKKHKS